MSVEKSIKSIVDRVSDRRRNDIRELKGNCLFRIRIDNHKLKEIFVDTIKFAIDKDLVNYLYTLLMLEKINNKAGMYRICVNEIMKTENVETIHKKSSELYNLSVMIGGKLDDIKLELSYLEIREKYYLSPLLVENHKDKTDSEKIDHMLVLIQHSLALPDHLYYSDESDDSEVLDV